MPAKILCVAGARPNFIKIAPILRALGARPSLAPVLVHTGQHYDEKLSQVFFEDLAIGKPRHMLAVGSGSHAAQTAELMKRFEPVLEEEQPEAVLVVGDVNSTLACAVVASKWERKAPFSYRGAPRRRPVVIHVEAGLRSGDWDMPEEINRKVTDAISDLLFVSDPAGSAHLAREGVDERRVFYVGNVMIDSLLRARAKAMESSILDTLGVGAGGYALLTLHRPSNVDDGPGLARLLAAIARATGDLALVFPVHPRTRSRLPEGALAGDRWVVCEPLGYLDFLRTQASAQIVVTDSGGVQEETTILGVRCVTVRENTERPVTITLGTNVLAGTEPAAIEAAVTASLARPLAGTTPPGWDGAAADRVADVLEELFST